MFKTRSLAVLIALVVNLISQATAQPARPNFNRPRTYDVEHYILRASFDRPAKKVIGDTTIRFKPLAGNFATAEFDAVNIAFSSITLEPSGTELKFQSRKSGIVVNLDRAYNAGESVTIRFRHTSVPAKGVYFVDEEVDNGKVVHSAQIWTQGEPDEARHWFPSFDFPSDKATLEQYITANEGETVVGNGELVEEIKNQDGTVTHHYRMNIPVPTYLVSFVIGKYAKVEERYKNVPLRYYIYPGMESIVPRAYGTTKDMMRVFEELTKIEYPFNKYDQTVVSGFTFGGMENITATTMADTEIALARFDFTVSGVHDLVSHELAHSWFGNMVTCNNWAELWLNEGFATFMEAAVREKLYGRRNYMLKVRRDADSFLIDDAVNPKRIGLFNLDAGNVSALFDRPATTYNKGGAVLHTLREELGDEAFWRGVNLYLTRHKLGNVESTDLLAAMEETSGRDLDWFFDQWVYMAGHPKLTVRQRWMPRTRTMRLTVTQTQSANKLVPAAFRLPLEVEFAYGRNKKMDKLNVTQRTQTFSFKLPARPADIKIDPEDKIPVKMVKML